MGLPVVQVSLDRRTLADLILAIVPAACSTDIDDPQRLWNLADVATRFSIPRISGFVRNRLKKLVPSRSFAAYLLASTHGWKDEAALAALDLTRQSIHGHYDYLLEDAPAVVYHALLQYHHQCTIAMSDVVRQDVGNHIRWKPLSKSRRAAKPISVILPVVEKELYPSCSKLGPLCRFCGSAVANGRSHEVCGHDVTGLVRASEKLENSLDKKVKEIKLELPTSHTSITSDARRRP